MTIYATAIRSLPRSGTKRNSVLRTPRVASTQLLAFALALLLALGSSSTFVWGGDHTVIAPRHCHGGVRHLHLAVGNAPSAARSMTVSFASTWAFPDRAAPVAGVFVGKTPPADFHSAKEYSKDVVASSHKDYTEFFAHAEFYPEHEDPIEYSIFMDHKRADSDLYHAPFQHHITIGDLEPNTKYYYLPVLGDRQKGIDSLEEDALVHFGLVSARDQLKDLQQEQHQGAVNIQSETQLTKEQQLLIEKTVDDGHRNLETFSRKQHFDYDESYLARDYDANSAIIEISQDAPMWDQNGRRLSPPPYDPTGIACIDAGKIRSFETAPDDIQPKHKDLYPMHFGVIGDIGQFSHSQEVLNHLRDHPKGIKAVVLVGDIAYPDFDGRKWDTFFDFLDDQSNFDEIPLMIAAGNHGKGNVA